MNPADRWDQFTVEELQALCSALGGAGGYAGAIATWNALETEIDRAIERRAGSGVEPARPPR